MRQIERKQQRGKRRRRESLSSHVDRCFTPETTLAKKNRTTATLQDTVEMNEWNNRFLPLFPTTGISFFVKF